MKPSYLKKLRIVPRAILRSSGQNQIKKSVSWYSPPNIEIDKNILHELSFQQDAENYHKAVSELICFVQNPQHIKAMQDSNCDIRSFKKESKFQSNIEKGLGFYDVDIIHEHAISSVPDFICHMCRKEFDDREVTELYQYYLSITI